MTSPATSSLLAAAHRTAALVTSVDDIELPLASSSWTLGETATHLAVALRGFAASAAGADVPIGRLPEGLGFSERVAAMNALTIGAEPKRDAVKAGQAIEEGALAFAAATQDLPPDRAIATPWYGEAESLTVAEATALLLGEQLVHGYDIAATAGRQWPITADDARLVFVGVRAMMPRMVNPDAGQGRAVTYLLHLGRGDRLLVRLDHGRAVVEPFHRQPVDCHVAGDPVALLLVGYGRISQWRAIGRAKLVTWGRRPWLSFRFPGSFSNP